MRKHSHHLLRRGGAEPRGAEPRGGPGGGRARRPLISLLTAGLVIVAGVGTATAATPKATTTKAAATAGSTRATARLRVASTATTTADATLIGGGKVDSAAAVAAVKRYWTPERMRNAIQVPNAPDPAAIQRAVDAMGPTGRPESTAPAAPTVKTGNAPTTNPIEMSSTGKVFYHSPNGGDYECSAAAVNSPSKSLVITAGHCVNQGNGGGWMQEWTFVPEYRNGNRPFDTWAAKQFRAFDAWTVNGDYTRDVAMVTMFPDGGAKLVNMVGGNGLYVNWSRTVDVMVWGYPSNHENGEVQWWCRTQTRPITVFDPRIQVPCAFGEGSSGGPWIVNYNEGTRKGWIDGVTSVARIDNPVWIISPYFDTAIKTMYDDQGGVT